jgi:hypothetical protein
MAGISAFFIPNPLPWIAAVGGSLALSGALWLRYRNPRSLAGAIRALGVEPARAVGARRVSPAPTRKNTLIQ